MKKLRLFSLLYFAATSLSFADNGAITQSLAHLDMAFEQIEPSPINGISTVFTEKGLFYISDDGRYIFQAPLFAIEGQQIVNMTQKALLPRVNTLIDQAITFKAPIEKYAVTIFTDPTCGYCAKLQKQIDKYNQLGITIHYLAFPRQGLNSDEATEMQNIWCADDKRSALNDAFARKPIPAKQCDSDIAQHYRLALQLGIEGTPAIIYKDTLIPGYLSPDELFAMLARQDKAKN